MMQIVRKEKAEERRVKIGQGKVWIERIYWGWDEEREELRDGRGRYWSEVGGGIRKRKEENRGKELKGSVKHQVEGMRREDGMERG